jgi:hypothetical protein
MQRGIYLFKKSHSLSFDVSRALANDRAVLLPQCPDNGIFLGDIPHKAWNGESKKKQWWTRIFSLAEKEAGSAGPHSQAGSATETWTRKGSHFFPTHAYFEQL